MAELFSKLSQNALNYAWRSTGVDKFAALPSESPNLSSDEVINELNEKLEERLMLTED